MKVNKKIFSLAFLGIVGLGSIATSLTSCSADTPQPVIHDFTQIKTGSDLSGKTVTFNTILDLDAWWTKPCHAEIKKVDSDSFLFKFVNTGADKYIECYNEEGTMDIFYSKTAYPDEPWHQTTYTFSSPFIVSELFGSSDEDERPRVDDFSTFTWLKDLAVIS